MPLGTATSGGQAIEELARGAAEPSFKFPIPSPGGLAFSYSGLKSAVKRNIGNGPLSLDQKREIAVAFQNAAVGQLEEKLELALERLQGQILSSLVASGGVASNGFLRERCRIDRCSLQPLIIVNRLRYCLDKNGRADTRLLCPPVALCTDNATMIAWAALERLERGMLDDFDSPIRPKWPIKECGEVHVA